MTAMGDMQIGRLPFVPLLLLLLVVGICQSAVYYKDDLEDNPNNKNSNDVNARYEQHSWALSSSSSEQFDDDGMEWGRDDQQWHRYSGTPTTSSSSGNNKRGHSSSSSSFAHQQHHRRQNRHFKQYGHLDSPTETWPEDFFHILSICRNATAPWKVYKREGASTCPNGSTVAVGRYRNAQNESGWGILEVQTFAGFAPELQAYAAGLVEGILTKVQIFYNHKNTVAGLCKNETDYCKRLHRYLNANLEWIRSQVHSQPAKDLYWRQVNLTFTQLTGINDGYGPNKDDGFVPKTNFYITPVFMLQLSGELFDLEHLFKRKKRDRFNSDPEPGKCSGFVKVTEGNKDLLMSHVAMSGYNTMNRVVKLYKFAYDPSQVPGNTVSFSGYAGVLASTDDYTLTSAGLLSIETTIAVFNESLYKNYVKPKGQLHCWVRSVISNQLAATAHDWVKLFARYNSGTYNNQWTVVAYNLFKPGQELPESDLIWVLEQIPGTTMSRDITWFVRRYGYWPSYNIPYLRKISELSGFDSKAGINNWWRWGYTPRAHIFHREQAKVKDLGTLRALMRYNNYKHDEFSRCKCHPPYSAEASISTRGDLNPQNGSWEVPGMGFRNHGSLDYKGTNYELFKQLRLDLIGGPTYGGESDLPPFSWQNTKVQAPHWGQPLDWNFKPFVTLWSTPVKMNFAAAANEDNNGNNDADDWDDAE